MGNYNRGGFGGRSGGRSSGGFGRRDGGFGRGDRERRPVELHDAVCDKCKKACQVPFRPSAGKPVLCRDCFKQSGGGSSSRGDSGSRGGFSPRGGSSSGISPEQFNQLNAKIDKIIKILEDLELDVDEGEEEGADEDSEEEIEADSKTEQ